ncbi:MAG: MopE-related protein, partial [Deltaproteobacteria bacterium]|nr:MopE-related protein [Deltaproteobacteria bacterium]
MIAGSATAQDQVKPRILIVFDTSGSMAFHVNGDANGPQTAGDGTNDPWTGGRFCCPGTGGSRMYIGKEAMRQMIYASGDIEFGLMKFKQDYTQTGGYSLTYYYYNQTSSDYDVLRYRDGNDTFDQATKAPWLCVGFGTGGAENNPAQVVMWMDQHEYSATNLGQPDTNTLSADGTEQELRADGNTPLGEAMQAAYLYLRDNYLRNDLGTPDPYRTCRKYSIIVLTDGQSNGTLSPVTWTTNLYSIGTLEAQVTDTVRVDTWVIGLSYSNATLDSMAANGGAHYDPSNPGHAFFANSEESLSSILYQVVAGSIKQEICNGLDDDCDNQTDEGFTKYCLDGDPAHLTECTKPNNEVCDGHDNNCDGTTDQGLTPPQNPPLPSGTCSHTSDPTNPYIGACTAGSWVCQGTTGWVCGGGVSPNAESCNGIDDNCDGTTDEGNPGGGGACGSYGLGDCHLGTYQCTGGALVCAGATTTPGNEGSSCDGHDNDCDGQSDEGISQVCGGGTVNSPNSICRQGIQYCNAAASTPGNPVWLTCSGNVDPRAETCNGLNDDCDTDTDEDVTGMGGSCGGASPNGCPTYAGGICPDGANQGACQAGTLSCTSGAVQCDAAVGPTSEGSACNNVDDDCDGQTDEGISQACGGGGADPNEGDCQQGVQTCSGGTWGTCQGAIAESPEACDNRDNDCDGSTDESLSQACGGAPGADPNAGDCQQGTQTCSGGVWSSCSGAIPPALEICDGHDNDCDTQTDEGVTQACGGCDPALYPAFDCNQGYEAGRCRRSTQTCNSGASSTGNPVWNTCTGDVGPVKETCNGIDDDCDGSTDEDILPADDARMGVACNKGICAGTTICVNGQPACSNTTTPGTESCDGFDDDCDGSTDENLTRPCGGGPPPHENDGLCQQGIQICQGGQWGAGTPWAPGGCQGNIDPVTTPDVCDGVDDDCDGSTDEDYAFADQPCGAGACLGKRQCVSGQDLCVGAGVSTPEVCDGIDNDCDNQTDEGVTRPCGGGPPGNENTPPCQVGYQECDPVHSTPTVPVWKDLCVGGQGPVGEACDDGDNDCDGLTDEDLYEPCGGCDHVMYPAFECTHGYEAGRCRRGIRQCDTTGPGWLACQNDVAPEKETCNGFDDDCDGATDDGIDPADDTRIGKACGKGICAGTSICLNGQIACSNTTTPGTESCNGLDDDCDGTTDENVTRFCGGGPPSHENDGICQQGIQVCQNNQWGGGNPWVLNACQGNVDPRSPDICNGVDDDCDGTTDEDFVEDQPCGPPCNDGLYECLNGVQTCVGATIYSAEVCDGIDNDCDDLTDELLTRPCGGGPMGYENTGICRQGDQACDPVNSTVFMEVWLTCVGNVDPGIEQCNGLDDDCDTQTDEGIWQACGGADPDGCGPAHDQPCQEGSEEGECRSGIQDCDPTLSTHDPWIPAWKTCEGNIDPIPEKCDGLDNDCDGETDEEPNDIGGKCGKCLDGTWICVSGQLVCDGASDTKPETCDGRDNDCDNQTDEGVTQPCGGGDPNGCDTEVYDGGVCPDGEGEGACQQGVQECAAAPDSGVENWAGCVGEVLPTQEACDSLDNDCDGVTDEESQIETALSVCQDVVGNCEEGLWRCVDDGADSKALECCADVDTDGLCVEPRGPEVEECDNEDNDCDQATDEGLSQPCGGCDPDLYPGADCTIDPNEGECTQGVSVCVAGVYGQCLDDQGPTAEQCDLLDNDCDGETDEGVVFNPPECSLSPTANPDEGVCAPGVWICDHGDILCSGTGPGDEVCNGKDDDCDGQTDEDLLEAGQPCGKDLGICKAGITQCVYDQADGEWKIDCVGATSGTDETCNGLDDDCDGQTDEGVANGATCTNSQTQNPNEGVCKEGEFVCVNGVWECNANKPAKEI